MASGASVPMNRIERAHQMYREGLYEEALGFYTEALGMAKTKPQKIALHSNRAACFLKFHNFKKAAEECTSVLELDHNHTGALMLRAQTLVTLKEYHSALFDVNRLMELNPSSEVYRNLQSRLKTQLSLAPIPEAEAELEEEDEDKEESESKRDEEVLEDKDLVDSEVGRELKNELETSTPNAEVIPSQTQSTNCPSEQNSSGWQAIPKPKGHTQLDYSRWDRVEDESSEDDDEDNDEESQPQYRFRVRTVGVQRVK
ncbi:hsp70/Hsp90 co-chaperone cns1-like isoform X1 [Actinidia eriantha]|uniref:hsp70/Hsp90 co-chaperone cns1-like isoform X1 n=2 Tax=Actinidia eriantha TaxID=165200 RepID=UPI002586330F|nr:hsp70/Hsp90 co-chaperone cns1-like isoform X1 [Actinidia eriantha]XP_057461720.1 hsp70/Hsp90 co-chaperone cns1-like isoform X1 [Actinidia eriantha]